MTDQVVGLRQTRVTDMTGRQLWDEQAMWALAFGATSVVLVLLWILLPDSLATLTGVLVAPAFGVLAMIFGLLGARERWQGYVGRGWSVVGALLGTVVATVGFVLVFLTGAGLLFVLALTKFLDSFGIPYSVG